MAAKSLVFFSSSSSLFFVLSVAIWFSGFSGRLYVWFV